VLPRQLCSCFSRCRRYRLAYMRPLAADAAAAVAVAALELHIPLPPSPSRIRAPSLWLALLFVCACSALTSLPFVTLYCKSIISVLTIIFAYLCI